MIIALASPSVASTLDDGLNKIQQLLSEAAARDAEIVCFPEAYLPGLRGQDFEVIPWDPSQQDRALKAVAQMCRTYAVATVLGLERMTDAGRQIVAVVIDGQGEVQGLQTKNQLDPSEDQFYVPGNSRRLFEINGVKFGVAICHEGWRYPETVRWAAIRGARIVFHPQHTGSNTEGVRRVQWGALVGPYYEKAMMMRSIENTIYFASVNYALRFQESATTLISPSGECQAFLPYGQEGVLVQTIDVEKATGLLATRYAPDRYQESTNVSNPVSEKKNKKPLWSCPDCGQRFVTRNMSHSCGYHSIDEHFADKPPKIRETFDALLRVVQLFGPVHVYAQKSRIVFQTRGRFVSITPRKSHLGGHIWLKRRRTHPVVFRIESLLDRDFVHNFRLHGCEDLDENFCDLLREAYEVGSQDFSDGSEIQTSA